MARLTVDQLVERVDPNHVDKPIDLHPLGLTPKDLEFRWRDRSWAVRYAAMNFTHARLNAISDIRLFGGDESRVEMIPEEAQEIIVFQLANQLIARQNRQLLDYIQEHGIIGQGEYHA